MTKFCKINHFSQIYLTKNQWLKKFVVSNLKPQVHPIICQETKVLSDLLLKKKLHDKVFFIFDKKAIFYLKMIWHVNCGSGIFLCPWSRMTEGHTDRDRQIDRHTDTHMMTIPLGQGVKTSDTPLFCQPWPDLDTDESGWHEKEADYNMWRDLVKFLGLSNQIYYDKKVKIVLYK